MQTYVLQAVLDRSSDIKPVQTRILGGDEDIFACEPALTERDTGLLFVSVALGGVYEARRQC